MKPYSWAILSVGALILAGCGKRDPATLASDALTASTTPRRVAAAKQLAKLAVAGQPERTKGRGVAEGVADLEKAAVAGLRKVAAESQDPEVLVVAIEGLSAADDGESRPLLYTHMDHADKEVREAAFNFVLRLHGGTLPGKLNYQADDPVEKRSQVTKRLRDLQEKAKTDPLPK